MDSKRMQRKGEFVEVTLRPQHISRLMDSIRQLTQPTAHRLVDEQ